MMNRLSRWAFLLAFTSLFHTPLTSAADWVYSAQKGDTLWDLCLTYTNKRGCWIELGRLNKIENDRAIPVGTAIYIPADWLKQQPQLATVLAVAGDVNYQPLHQSDFKPLTLNQWVHLGGIIQTGEGTATLTFDGNHQVLVRPQSVVTLTRISNSRVSPLIELNLSQGEVEANVDSGRKQHIIKTRSGYKKPAGRNSSVRFKITTPAAIAAVRGTEFRVNSSGDQGQLMRGEVTTGVVAFSAQQQVQEVPAGFGVAAEKGKPPGEPRQLLPAPILMGDIGTLSNPVSIKWQAQQGARRYQVDLFAKDKVTLLHSQQTPETIQYLPTLPSGCYQLKLRAIDKDGFNGLDAQSELCVVERLSAPKTEQQVLLTQLGWRINWQTVEGADSYLVEIAKDLEFKQIIDRQQVAEGVFFVKSARQPQYLRVIAVNERGQRSSPSKIEILADLWQDIAAVSVFTLLLLVAL